jgi:hypothetical protein
LGGLISTTECGRTGIVELYHPGSKLSTREELSTNQVQEKTPAGPREAVFSTPLMKKALISTQKKAPPPQKIIFGTNK